ncbi:TerD family protein [Streptomyces sp. NPDC002851]
MKAELVRGQNHLLPQTRLEIRVSAGQPVVAGATLSDDQGKVRGTDWVAHPGAHRLPGLEVSRQAAADHRLAVDLDALPESVDRVNVLLALPVGVGGPAQFGAVAAPFVAVTGLDGTEVASYTITDLDTESAVVAVELYRRRGDWKVRAVGQGYAGGLADMLSDQGLPGAREIATDILDAVADGMARAVSVPPPPAPRTAEGDRVRQPAPVSGAGAGAGSGSESGSASASASGTEAGAAAEAGVEPAGAGTSGSGAAVNGASGTETSGTGTPDSTGAPSTGPINYTHPARTPAAPPKPPTTEPAHTAGSTGATDPTTPPTPVAGDATGWSMEERLYNQVWGMFEDLARSTAAYRSAVDFAESRLDQELDKVLADPEARTGGHGEAAREAARAKHTELTDRARAALDRDLAQLTAEAEVVEPALPPSFAAWDNPVWHAYRVPMDTPMALRLGDLHLPESTELRIPMLVRLPLERGLWIDSGRTASSATASLADGDELRRLAMDNAVAHAARLLAVHPPGDFSVHVIDPAGAAASALAPLVDAGVLAGEPAAGAAGVSEVLAQLTRRVDLVQMAVRGGAPDSLPSDVDTAEQLLIVNDFPHGFDDRAVTQLRYLADEGPSVGVHLMMVADREDAAEFGPVLDPLWRSLLRLTPVPDSHLADPWVGHAWTYEPALTPPGSDVLHQVLERVADARRSWGR